MISELLCVHLYVVKTLLSDWWAEEDKFSQWESPWTASPEAVLKSAAKTFIGTPYIVKKQNRDLCSRLYDKRCGKKVERGLFVI